MDNASSAPIGVPLATSSPLQEAAKPIQNGDCEANAVVHRPEDNPRPAVAPEQAGFKELDSPPTSPLAVDVIPPTFSQSSWARRNALIRSVRRRVPFPIRLVIHIVIWVGALGCAIASPALACVPGVVAILIGNVIFKAANLPGFQTSAVIPFSGCVSAGAFAAATCIPLLWPLWKISNVLDDRYKARHILSGRLPATSTRKDGHFPVLILSIPFFYVICVITGAYAKIPSGGAVGGVFAAPFSTFAIPITVAVLEIIFKFNIEVIQGHPDQTEPLVSPYLARQFEALVWLFSSRKSLQASLTANSSEEATSATLLIGAP